MKKVPMFALCALAGAPLSVAHAQVLYDNGPLATPNQTGACIPAGSGSSTLQTGNTTLGFGHQSDPSINNRVADDFTIPTGETWTINQVQFFAYQTGGSPTSSSFTDVNFQIWDGVPGDPGSTVVFGDTTTNRLTTSTFDGLYRHGLTTCGVTRPIYRNTATAGVTLSEGTYWIDWQTGGSIASGPWAPPVTIEGQQSKTGANGLQSLTGAPFTPALDNASFAPQDFPFVLLGQQSGGGCYANCDGSTGTPILNTADFGCFLTKFAAGDPYANCDGSTGMPTLNVADFGCFLAKFAAGCN